MAPKQQYWQVSYGNILIAIYWATKKLRYSIDRPGMNRRTQSEALDDKIMGDVATLAVLEYLNYIKVKSIVYDHYRTDNFKQPDPGWDILLSPNADELKDKNLMDLNNIEPKNFKTVSVKSSRLPKGQSVCEAIKNRDFKIFKYSDKIENDIKTNLEIQVYYRLNTTQLGNLSVTTDDINLIKDSVEFSADYCMNIEKKLNVANRWGECALVGYDEDHSIIKNSYTLQERYWSSFGKEMWYAPLRFGKDMSTLK